MRKFTPAALRATRAGRGLLTVMAVGAIASAGVLGTNATFSDDVTMAQITVTGGTLDLVANSDTDDTAVAWGGSITADVSNMAPGESGTGTVTLENVGNLPFTLTASTVGVDASGCFGYWLRETGPANITNLGTADSDGGVVPLATDVTNEPLLDNDDASAEWEAADSTTYELTIRMLSTCNTNGANGTLDVSFAADQV